MEKEGIYEVLVYKNDVAPGYYYDGKTRYFSPAQDTECIQTKVFTRVEFDIKEKGVVNNLVNGICMNQNWALDYVKEKPHDVVLIKGSNILEKRAVELPRDRERWRVLSVLYKYHAKMLICFSEEISNDLLEMFENHLVSIVNNVDCSILPQSFVNKFQSGFLYPHFLGPGFRFEKLMYGVKEFCLLLQNSKKSTVPLSAMVKCPCVRLADDKSVSSQEPVSGELKSKMRSESNVVLRTESIVSSSTHNVPEVHLEGNQRRGSVGHGIAKSSGVKSEAVNTPGRNVGRGRGTMIGRGKSNVAPVLQNNKDTRIGVGENRTIEPGEVSLDREMKHLCNILTGELGSTSLKSDNVKMDFTGDTSVVNFSERVKLDAQKSQNSVGKEEKSLREEYEERKEIPLDAHEKNSSCGSYHQNKHCRAPRNLANGEATATKVVEFSRKPDENIAKKADSDTQKFENIQSKNRSSQKNNSVEKSESVAQKSNECKKTSVPESEFSGSIVHRPDVNTRELVKMETEPGNEMYRLNDTKAQINAKKSESTKKETTSRITNPEVNARKSENTKKETVTAKERKLNNRVQETAQKSGNATRGVDPKRKIKNGNVKTWNTDENTKNPKTEANPKKELLEGKLNNQGRDATNVSQNKQKLYHGLGCEDDEDEESSLLKIGNQKNCTGMRSKKCKEQLQMKSTFLEATETHDNVLGFRRKYYGVVNDSSLEKVILLLGASGSGKTTLINLAANYFKEKKSADEELYHVVPTSPTSDIAAYTFCSAFDEIPITIIDTPGLNDSSGAEIQDHVQALKTFLANASANDFHIHAIGFVAQAYLVRLTSSERLVMDYVTSLFGQGVKDHLITLVTFADNQDSPPVVEAMKSYGVDFKVSLKFNNSALHNSKADEVDDIDRVYWRVCWRNWKKCLKVLRDLPPLSASTMKAVQNEVFASTVLKSAERNLRVSLKIFFSYSEKDRIVSKEASQVCAEIWNLAAVLHHFKGLNVSHGSILAELAKEICKTQHTSPEANVYFLSLNREKPLVASGLEVIRIMAPVYKEAKTWHKESNTFSRNVTLWTYCHSCETEHAMKRESPGIIKKIIGLGEDVLALKCSVCKCPGDMHGVCKTKSPFRPDAVLSRTCTALQKIIAQYSIPNFPVSEFWYLKFLDHLFHFEHTEFIHDILSFIKK